MDTTTATERLGRYRQAFYRCLTRARAALYDRCDALATFPEARSFVDLARAPSFQRRWPSLYEALEDGRIDRPALRTLFVETRPPLARGQRLVVVIDVSPIPRPYAHTAADRTLVHVPAAGRVLPPGVAPVMPGWAFSTVAVVPDPPSSRTHILDQQRVPSDGTATTTGAAQLTALAPLLPKERERSFGAMGGTGPRPGSRPPRIWT